MNISYLQKMYRVGLKIRKEQLTEYRASARRDVKGAIAQGSKL